MKLRAQLHPALSSLLGPLCLSLSLVTAAPLLAQETTETPTETPTAGEQTEAAKRPTALADIPSERVAFETRSRAIRQNLVDQDRLSELNEQLTEFEKELDPVLEKARDGSITDITVTKLMELSSTIFEIEAPLATTTESLDDSTRLLETYAGELRDLATRWEELDSLASTLQAPPEIENQVDTTRQEIAELSDEVLANRNELLVLFSRATTLNVEVAGFRTQASDYERRIRKETLLAEDLPLWKLGWQRDEGSIFHHVWLQFRAEIGHLVSYFKVNAARILFVFLGSLVALHLLLGRLKGPAKKLADEDPHAALAHKVLDPTWPITTILSLLLTLWLSPPGPAAYYESLLFLIPFPAAVLVLRARGESLRFSVIAIAVSLALITVRPYLELSPLLDRLILIAQCVTVATAILWDLKRDHWDSLLGTRWRPVKIRTLQSAAVVLYLTALLATFGQVGLARELRSGVLGTLGFGLVFGTLYLALESLANTGIRTASARSRPIIRNHPRTIYLWIQRILAAATLIGWLAAALYSFDIFQEAQGLLVAFLNSGIKFRAVDISIGDVLVFALVIASSFLVAKIICLLLEEEFLPRLKLKRGLPYAISTVTRYIILVVGFIIAMAAVGIDLSKTTLLAGAFGVGIGFGLQNVVNNFVSGLILLFERPVQVGDAIEVDTLLGEVTGIGIRASTVRTYQGAEVIVPNGDLISRQVVNWTFSNRRRRVEVPIGVAYGTDPQTVIDLLLEIANNHPRVDSDPEPTVVFTNFGESSLDFNLRCWVNIFEEGLAVGTDLRVQIVEALKEAGIEIPFPQRDVHLRKAEE